MGDRYYTDWDRWFATEHDGTPVEWVVAKFWLKGEREETEGLTMFPMKADPKQKALPNEEHEELHRFMASSYIEAMNKGYAFHGWGRYKPSEDWDVEKGCYKSE